MKYLIPLAAAAMFAALPASAQRPQITVEALQNAMNNHFGEGSDLSLLIAKGEPGTPGAWMVRRQITGGSTPKRCSMRIEVPTVIENQGVNSATTSYTIDWALVRDVKWDGERTVRFTSSAMAPGEYAELRVESSTAAGQVEAVLKFLSRECSKGTE